MIIIMLIVLLIKKKFLSLQQKLENELISSLK
nr:MAG TPA: hypothetical protein [Crassvirales sp.]